MEPPAPSASARAPRTHGPQLGAARLTLLALAVYGLFALIVALEVWLGLMAPGPSVLFCAVSLLGILAFYALVRSGLSQRLSRDASLTQAQSVFGVAMTAWGYAINPHLRGAVIAIMLLNLVWGMFVLSPRQALNLCLLALGLLAATMLWKSSTDPHNYPAHIEVIHFLFCIILLSAMSTLSVNMGRLRSKLSARKSELQAALERIQALAQFDELTHLSNRRHLGELLAAERMRQLRTGQPLTLVMLDLDQFKAVNDTHGHAVGDAVLRRFAASIQPALRATDMIGRWGGEEFLLAAPGTTIEMAQGLVERMRHGLAQTSFDDIAPALQVSFSAGATVCLPGEASHVALERADRALYQAKAEGRNRTAVA